MSLNQKVSWYLMSSYAYYEKDISLFSDKVYDQICQDLLKDFDKIEHIHKHLLDKDLLKCGSGFGIKFPLRVIGAAELAIKNFEDL